MQLLHTGLNAQVSFVCSVYRSGPLSRPTDGGNHWSLMEIQGIKGMEALSIFSIDSLIAYITLDNPDSAGDGGIYKTITVD